MSHILLKQVQDNLITTPASNYVKFFSNFNDNGLLYYMDNSGVPTPVGGGVGGSTYNPVIEITYSDLYSLTGNFATGSYYYITEFESVYEQPDFYLDGTPKTVLDLKGKPSIAYQPIVVMATSNNTLASDAYQPFFPKDKIKYDFTWNKTEFNRNARGRITERIDSNGNRTDYDHRTIRFKRYQSYDKSSLLLGTITSYNCVTGELLGNSTSFGDCVIGDVLLIDSDSMSGGDLSYTIGLRVKSVIDDSTIEADVDNLYTSGVPSAVVLNSTSQIIPINYSFTSKNYTYSKGTPTSQFNSYKEIYFGQSDASDFDNNVFTFPTTGYGANIVSTVVNNYIGDYSHVYLNGSNNSLILSNNVFGNTTDSFNTIGSNSYNNHLSSSSNNKIGNFFYNNIVGDMFQYNLIKCEVSNLDLTSSTHIYNSYNCEIFRNSNNVVRLSYYNGTDVLTITDIDA